MGHGWTAKVVQQLVSGLVLGPLSWVVEHVNPVVNDESSWNVRVISNLLKSKLSKNFTHPHSSIFFFVEFFKEVQLDTKSEIKCEALVYTVCVYCK